MMYTLFESAYEWNTNNGKNTTNNQEYNKLVVVVVV